MKDTVVQCTRALLEAIKDSEEYREFEKNRQEIAKYPELKNQADEFRKKTYLLQNSDSSIDMMDEMERLFEYRTQLYKNSVMGEYLLSELRICRMLQKISMEVMNVTDVEIEAFEDVISV